MIDASQLYDYVQCPHRVYLDAFGDPSLRDDPNAFVELLWDQGLDHEKDMVADLGITADMSGVPVGDREYETRRAMGRGEPLIYQGYLTSGDRRGAPDILERRGGGYFAGDIKSGSGLEGDEEEGKLKKHYAVQVGHYANILEIEGLGYGHEAFVIDRTGTRVPYALEAPQGVRNPTTWWTVYLDVEESVRGVLAKSNRTRPALCATCKLCRWFSLCKAEIVESNDLSMIAELGRSKRDAMIDTIPTVQSLAASDLQTFIRGKKTIFAGIGSDTLVKFQVRARLLSSPDPKPYLKQAVQLPMAEKEVLFDIEADPMRDVVYLHGFVEREHGKTATSKFISYFADGLDPADEEAAFRSAWAYISARARDSVVYYYSKYERTAYRRLAARYPAVCSEDQVNKLFGLPIMVDLYSDVVKPATEWPTYDQSIKSLAHCLGFNWRDTDPSGAASIEWYHRWIETADPAVKQRILEYNEDDCLATGVVVDEIRRLSAVNGQSPE